jgi:hypothetical protein
MAHSEFVSVADLAAEQGCDPATIKRRIYRGDIPAHKVAGVWLIRRDDLEQVA